MKIYGNPMSTCTRRVLMALEEKHGKYELVTLDFAKADHKSAANLARQPFGQIPSLVEGDFTLFESRAMMRYIDETVAGQSLTPKDAKHRALMEQWISVEMEQYNAGAAGIVGQEIFAPMFGGQADPVKVEEAKSRLKSALAVLDKHLANGPHFVGDQFTLADICYMPYTDYALNTSAKELILSHTHFATWWKRVSARPAWLKATGK